MHENTIFFDGLCNLCNGAVDFVISRDKKMAIKYCSLQSEVAKNFLVDMGENTQNMESICFWHKGRLLKKSRAVLAIAKHLGWFWMTLSFLAYLVPIFLADRLYDLVAKNRYKWFGKREFCRLASEEEQKLFVC